MHTLYIMYRCAIWLWEDGAALCVCRCGVSFTTRALATLSGVCGVCIFIFYYLYVSMYINTYFLWLYISMLSFTTRNLAPLSDVWWCVSDLWVYMYEYLLTYMSACTHSLPALVTHSGMCGVSLNLWVHTWICIYKHISSKYTYLCTPSRPAIWRHSQVCVVCDCVCEYTYVNMYINTYIL